MASFTTNERKICNWTSVVGRSVGPLGRCLSSNFKVSHTARAEILAGHFSMVWLGLLLISHQRNQSNIYWTVDLLLAQAGDLR